MKKLTKLTVALLTLVMVFSLCACGGASLEKDIVGTWKIDYDMGEQMAAEMGSDFADFGQIGIQQNCCIAGVDAIRVIVNI